MMVAGLFVLAASLLAIAALTVAPQANTVVRWGQVACLAIFIGAFWLTVGPASGIVISEIYPQSIRGRATSLGSTMHGVFAIAFTLTFPLLLHGLGLSVTLVGLRGDQHRGRSVSDANTSRDTRARASKRSPRSGATVQRRGTPPRFQPGRSSSTNRSDQSADQPFSAAKRGLITSSMIARRSSNGMNADSIALIVNCARSVQP